MQNGLNYIVVFFFALFLNDKFACNKGFIVGYDTVKINTVFHITQVKRNLSRHFIQLNMKHFRTQDVSQREGCFPGLSGNGVS